MDPWDCDPETAITKHTRFRMHENRRMGREKLRKYLAKLKEPKLQALLLLRERFP